MFFVRRESAEVEHLPLPHFDLEMGEVGRGSAERCARLSALPQLAYLVMKSLLLFLIFIPTPVQMVTS